MVYPNIYEERRKNARVVSRCPLRYQFKGKPLFVDTITRDISEGGLRFISNEFIPAFAELFLELSLRPAVEPVRTLAQVAWVQKVPHSDQYHVGTRFTDINEELKKNISGRLQEYKEYPFQQI